MISDTSSGVILNSQQQNFATNSIFNDQSTILDTGVTQVHHLAPASINENIQLSQPQLIDSSQGIPSNPTILSVSQPQVLSVGQPQFIGTSQPQITGFSSDSRESNEFFNQNSGSQNGGQPFFLSQSFGQSQQQGVLDVSHPQVLSVSQPQVLSVSQPQVQ